MPLCTANTADLGLSPITLIKLEDFGLKLDERICPDYSSAQGMEYPRCCCMLGGACTRLLELCDQPAANHLYLGDKLEKLKS